jgi:hypothetical protein
MNVKKAIQMRQVYTTAKRTLKAKSHWLHWTKNPTKQQPTIITTTIIIINTSLGQWQA